MKLSNFLKAERGQFETLSPCLSLVELVSERFEASASPFIWQIRAEPWIQFRRPLPARLRLYIALQLPKYFAEIEPCFGVIRIEFSCSDQFVGSALEVASIGPRHPQKMMRVGVEGLEANGSLEMSEPLCLLA
jgi:hypothetical protein